MLTQAPLSGFFVRLTTAILFALTLPLTAQAADAQKEIATAAEHAGYAADSDTVAKVHLHLHHAINCLVGPDGEGFDAQSGNPCEGQGNGAMNDLDSGMADKETDAKDALALAKTGTELQSADAAKSVAETVQKLLTSTR